MPLYLVRWPRLEACLVRADDEEHLMEILDEAHNPGGASWMEYRGALWIDFKLAMEATEKDAGRAWSVRNVEQAAKQDYLGATLEEGDCPTGCSTMAMVIEHAFPHLSEVLEACDYGPADPEDLRAAALKDLESHQPGGVLFERWKELYVDD